LESISDQVEGFDPGEWGLDLDVADPTADIEVEEDDFDPDAEPVPTTCKAGDVWQLGNHRLMCGDSTKAEDVAKLMQGEQADLWLTDPPYNVAYEGGTGMTIMNDSMEDGKFREFLRGAYSAADSMMRPGAAFYVWHANSEGYNFRGAARDVGWQVRQCLIWEKSSLVLGRQDYQWSHEPCIYGWKDGAAHYWGSDRKQTTVMHFDKPSRSELHPTMKHVALFEYEMLNSSKQGDIVLDSFGGSGTTIIAAEKNGRRARVMEMDPKYCDVIIRRWQDFTGKEAVLDGDGRTFVQIGEEREGGAA
jgi:site-specific DNA-methyltransferase (adenine-specific)